MSRWEARKETPKRTQHRAPARGDSGTVWTLAAALIWLLSSGPLMGAERNYKRWLQQEVGWIISKAERESFRQAGTDQQREQFIEQFWADRDPTPGTPKNEYQEEHYRRLKYSTENFAETGPGWRSDRGRVYIIHGPPVSRSIDAEQEIWTYNSNPNAEYYSGPITLVFERRASSFQERLISESRLAQQKAAARPGAPPNPLDQLRVTPRLRLMSAGPGFRPQLVPTAGETDRYIADILRSPGEVLEDLKAERGRRQERIETLRQEVRSRVSFQPLPFDLETYWFPLGAEEATVLLHVALAPADLVREHEAARQPARFDLYCEVRDAANDSLLDAFDTTLARGSASRTEALEYLDRFQVPVAPIRVTCLLRGLASGRTGKQAVESGPTPASAGPLRLGKPILTQRIRQVERREAFDPLVVDDTLFAPQERRFDPSQPLYLLFHVFRAAQPPTPGNLFFDYQIHTRDRVFYRARPRPLPAGPGPAPLPCALSLDLSSLDSGRYFLMVKIHDSSSQQYALVELPFELQP